MAFKLRTSSQTANIFDKLNASIHVQPFALCKLSIALSLKKPIEGLDFNTDQGGLELNRQTITGEFDELFKALIINHCGKKLSDNEYFPKYLKAHIDRGAKLLLSEYEYNNTNFYVHLVELEKSI